MAGSTPTRFVVPVRGVNTVCTVARGELVPFNPLPQIGDGAPAINDEFGWVAWVAEGGTAIGLTHLDAGEGEGQFAPLPLPAGHAAACLPFHRRGRGGLRLRDAVCGSRQGRERGSVVLPTRKCSGEQVLFVGGSCQRPGDWPFSGTFLLSAWLFRGSCPFSAQGGTA